MVVGGVNTAPVRPGIAVKAAWEITCRVFRLLEQRDLRPHHHFHPFLIGGAHGPRVCDE